MNKRIPPNKKITTLNQKKIIRKMFFQRKLLKNIEKETNLTERVVRRVINENNYQNKRERYWRLLCQKSKIHKVKLKEISKLTEVPYPTLTRIKRKYDLDSFRGEPWNKIHNDKIEEKIIKEYTSGATGEFLSRQYGYETSKSIYDILRKNEVKRRLPKVRTYYKEDFFEKIDSAEKAYILGFIMADGNIKKDYLGFEIQITKEDYYILEKISSLIGADKTHGLQKIDLSHRREKGMNAKDMVRLNVNNKKIANDLKNLGVVRNKSKILEYSNCVPLKFHNSFFRGLMDGDGSLGINRQTQYPWCHICTTASEKFACQIKDLHPQFKINHPTDNMWVVKVGGGKKKIYDFIKWLYLDKDKSQLYLTRKYEKVQNQIN